eukprot:s858_g30.t1
MRMHVDEDDNDDDDDVDEDEDDHGAGGTCDLRLMLTTDGRLFQLPAALFGCIAHCCPLRAAHGAGKTATREPIFALK